MRKPITVKKLIQLLSKYDQNMPVVIADDGPGYYAVYPITGKRIEIVTHEDLEYVNLHFVVTKKKMLQIETL